MAVNSYPAVSSSKTAYRLTLLSGTSWTVPTGVTYINATLIGGGGGGGGGANVSGDSSNGQDGLGGQIVESTFATTPGASISYSLGAGGTGGTVGGTGGTTTMTGATSAAGGLGGMASTSSGAGNAGQAGLIANNYGAAGGGGGAPYTTGGAGGAGSIIIEYYA
jgi:hypothetical protein